MFDIKRAALHFPVGIVAALLDLINWESCVVFSVGFLTYEVLEDWRIKDRSYKDVLGFVIGFGFGSFLLWLIYFPA